MKTISHPNKYGIHQSRCMVTLPQFSCFSKDNFCDFLIPPLDNETLQKGVYFQEFASKGANSFNKELSSLKRNENGRFPLPESSHLSEVYLCFISIYDEVVHITGGCR